MEMLVSKQKEKMKMKKKKRKMTMETRVRNKYALANERWSRREEDK